MGHTNNKKVSMPQVDSGWLRGALARFSTAFVSFLADALCRVQWFKCSIVWLVVSKNRGKKLVSGDEATVTKKSKFLWVLPMVCCV